MDIHSGEVEFRPLHQLWDSSPHNWRLEFFSEADRPSRMIHNKPGTRYLLDIRSKTFQGIASRILPLESSEYLTVVQSNNVSIELPRFRLSFFVNNGELESTNLRGMVIDPNQCTGTMIGLSSQLVLRHKDPAFASLPRSRCVLIPRGHIQFFLSPNKNHVRVHIDTCINYRRRVKWDKYEIDSDLGLLVGSVNLTSRLYKIYLHALCSHPLPDPLTGQTGTDHALQELNAAGCFSFQNLTKADVEFLRLIGNLTPHRYYYPQDLRVMQTIEWSSKLPALSQHGGFDATVCKIMEYAKSLSMFASLKENNDVELEYTCKGDPLLVARAAQRNAVFYEVAVKNRETSTHFDKRYDSRESPHIVDHDSDGTEALNTSRLVYAWPLGLTRDLEPSELLEAFKGWGHMNGLLEETSLTYTQEWLTLNLPEKWLSIYNLCRQLEPGESASKYQLIFSFAALAYSSPSLRIFIPILLAFATIHQSELIEPHPHSSYELGVGFEPLPDQVRIMIRSGTNDLDYSPARHLSQNCNETIEQLHYRQAKYYNEHISSRTDEVLRGLMMDPLSSYPQSPFHQANDSSWFDTEKIMKTVREYFASCSRNRDLRPLADNVTTILKAKYRASPLTGNVPKFSFAPRYNICTRHHHPPFTLENLLSLRLYSAPSYSHGIGTGAHINSRQLGEPINTSNLENLISRFQRKNSSKLAQLYSERLELSRQELHGQQTPALPNQLPSINDCRAYRDQCQSRLHNISSSIRSALAPSTTTEKILEDAGLWPRIHHRSMLYPLASTSNTDLSPEWAEFLTAFAEMFIEYQYSQRLLGYALQSDIEKYFKELDSASFNRQGAARNPDWLLIQVLARNFPRYTEFRLLTTFIFRSRATSSPVRSSTRLRKR